ncbi:MAG: LysM peptidoglycan-binding domain-containing protein [Chloroflexi bacterium]|nr:LysM peptidoglycan-binding domain-containing protein [Chloroflexota bacterium]
MINRDQFVFVIVVNAIVSAVISTIVVIVSFSIAGSRVAAVAGPDATTVAAPVAALSPTAVRRTQAIQYIVKPGDTLSTIAATYGIPTSALMQANGITNPNLLTVGQALTIPPPDLTPPAVSTIASAASPAPILRISAILRSTTPPSPGGETVIIQNLGARLNLKGWSLADLHGNLYAFPDIVVEPNTSLRLHSENGLDTAADLYWGRTTSVWDANDTATLKDRNGVVIDSYTIRR